MDYRPLGRTGVQVSKLCLGTMMFGAWGNTDHDDSIRIIHRALDAGINFVDTADVYSRRRVRGDRRQGAQGPPRRRRPGHQVLHADGRGPQPPRRLAALDHQRGRGLAAPPGHRLDRPLPGPPPRPGRSTSTRRSARSPTSSSRARSATSAPPRSPAAQIVEAQWAARERRPASASAPSSRPTRCSSAASSSTSCPTAQRHGMGILTYSPLAGGWLSGSWSADSSPTSPARQRLAARFDMSLPENQRKLEAVEQLAAGRRRRRPVDDRAGHRLRRQPPRRDLGDHRPAHDGAARQPAARRRRHARRRRCSTASTRSSRPASTSTPPTPATASRCFDPPCAGAERRATSSTAPRRNSDAATTAKAHLLTPTAALRILLVGAARRARRGPLRLPQSRSRRVARPRGSESPGSSSRSRRYRKW